MSPGRMVLAGLVVFVAAAVIWPRLANSLADPNAVHPLGTLPSHISVCGRDWRKDALNRVLSRADIRARDGVEPVVVDPAGPFGYCPGGPCTRTAEISTCDTVIYVRVAEDGFVDYSLQGGP